MHTIGQAWVKEHHDYAEKALSNCAYCHGQDFRGTDLSVAKLTRSYSIRDGRNYTMQSGTKVGCYSGHNGPKP